MPTKKLLCPLGGDETNDCDGCPYSIDYHFVDGECIRRPDDPNDSASPPESTSEHRKHTS